MKNKILLVLISSALAGCFGSTNTSTSSNNTTDTGTSTSSALCSLTNSGTQNLVYQLTPPNGVASTINENLAFSYSWSCDTNYRKLSGYGVPNHEVTNGKFATKVSVQSISVSGKINPVKATTSTNVQISGYALNSVPFDPNTAGTCPNSATSDTQCNYAMGSDTWKMEALPGSVTPWKFDFGADSSNAHVQPSGQYHYHGMPEGLITKLNTASTTSMTLVGWANDGFPIYARYGYTTASDRTSALKVITGSYRVKSTPSTNRPSTTNFPMGHFQQDWEYVSGLGDLDECNGRTGVTPEFPNGIYHYFITDSYPYIQRCVKGTV